MTTAVRRRLGALRGRYPSVDHLVRARERYTGREGDLLAAGVTYFAFLGLIPVLLLVAGVAGLVLADSAQLQRQVVDAVRQAVPGAAGDQLVAVLEQAIGVAGVTGLVGLVGALYAGLRTVRQLRIGMHRIWRGDRERPRFLHDLLADLAALAVLGALGLAGLAVTAAVSQETARVRGLLGLGATPADGALTWIVGLAVALAGDVAVFLWLLRVVASAPCPLRELLPGALFGTAGLEVLTLLGSWYLSLLSGSVTAAAFGGAFGVLVWINALTRFAFFTAAWTATRPAPAREVSARGR